MGLENGILILQQFKGGTVKGVLQFSDQKSLLSTFTHKQNAPEKLKAMLHEAIFLATCLATMTTEKHCKLQRGRHTFAIFFRNLQRPRWKLFTTLSPPLEISCKQKTASDCPIFTKLPCRFRWTCHTQDISTFLATRNATFCCRCRLQNWGVTRQIFLATCLATKSCKKNCLV